MGKAYVLRLTVSITCEPPLVRSLPLVLRRLWSSRKNVGAPTFKVLLEGLLQYKNRFEQKGGSVACEAVSIWDSNAAFPKMKKTFE